MTPKDRALTDQQLQELDKQLRQRHDALRADLEGLREESDEQDSTQSKGPGVSDAPTHPADAGSEAYESAKENKIIESQRDEMRAIEEALQRMEEGSYGLCLEDKKPIRYERLQAKPWAKLCMDCARKQESPRQ